MIYSNSVRITELTTLINDENVKSIKNAQEMLQQLVLSDWALSQYLLSSNPLWKNETYKFERGFKDSLRDGRRLTIDEETRQVLDKVKGFNQRYIQQTRIISDRFDQGLINPQHQQYFRSQESVVQPIIDQLQSLIV